jgi:hypothetical protein
MNLKTIAWRWLAQKFLLILGVGAMLDKLARSRPPLMALRATAISKLAVWWAQQEASFWARSRLAAAQLHAQFGLA